MSSKAISRNLKDDNKVFNVNFKSFLTALAMVAVLMIVTYVLTFVIPTGEYQRELDLDGNTIVVSGTYKEVDGGIDFLQWLGSPVLLFASGDGVTTLAVIFFLLAIGGAYGVLDEAGVLAYLLGTVYEKYNKKKYSLLALSTLAFMLLGSLIGTFEEAVPLVPVFVALSYALGWDALVGMGMSLLAVCCGFSCGILNTFTVGVAQSIADLQVFSGSMLRIITFVIIYGLLVAFLTLYAKKIERNPEKSIVFDSHELVRWINIQNSFKTDKKKSRSLRCFFIMLAFGIAVIIASAFFETLASVIMPVTGLLFIISGITTARVAGLSSGETFKSFFKGVGRLLPAVLVVMMASSVKYIITESKCLDTILMMAEKAANAVSPLLFVILMFALAFIVNLFVPSGSAEAMLLIPVFAPLADMIGISRQLSVHSYLFGATFSDMLFPTSPILLIALSLVGVKYGKWIRWSFVTQLLIILINIGILTVAYFIGF